jgi:predicted PurR-regulated permease PerM
MTSVNITAALLTAMIISMIISMILFAIIHKVENEIDELRQWVSDLYAERNAENLKRIAHVVDIINKFSENIQEEKDDTGRDD